MNDLKPCAHCGYKAIHYTYSNEGKLFRVIRCTNPECQMSTKLCKDYTQATIIWNKRSHEDKWDRLLGGKG